MPFYHLAGPVINTRALTAADGASIDRITTRRSRAGTGARPKANIGHRVFDKPSAPVYVIPVVTDSGGHLGGGHSCMDALMGRMGPETQV